MPGSMPADSTHARRGGRRDRAARARRRRDRASWWRRCASPAQRRADLRAQLAANRTGVARLRELAERLGRRRPARGHRRRARLRRAAHARLPRRRCPTASAAPRDVLEAREGDLELRAGRDRRGRRADARLHAARADQHDGNLNCPLAVTRSACLFAVRVLTDPDIPPTAGAYRPVDASSRPRAALLNARPPAAVAARQRRDLLARRRPRARRVRPRARARAR